MPELTEAAVGVSGGKDSVVTLDICRKHLEKVEGFFWYLVPDLSFQEDQLRTVERTFHVRIHRLPSVRLLSFLKEGTFGNPLHRANTYRDFGFKDACAAVRRETGMEWIAFGEKASDSPIRRTMLNKPDMRKDPVFGAMNDSLRRMYPCAWMSDKDVWSYMKRHQLPVASDYRILEGGDGHHSSATAFGNFAPRAMYHLKKSIPAGDWQKILAVFPFVTAAVAHYELYGAGPTKAHA